MIKANVYVSYKPSVFDPKGEVIKDAANKLGFSSVNKITIGKYIQIELDDSSLADLSSDDRDRKARKLISNLCDELLANSTTETYSFDISK